MLIVESRIFSSRRAAFLTPEAFRDLQNRLIDTPDKGDVIPGCGGLRKLRFAERHRGKGKRGGCRIIYLLLPECDRIDLIAIYSKNRKDDLSKDEKRQLRALAERARSEAIKHHRKKGRN